MQLDETLKRNNLRDRQMNRLFRSIKAENGLNL
jgi:hypothetical protein